MIGQIKVDGYAGVEKTDYYEYLRVGTIVKIDYNAPQKGGVSRRLTYGTAQIQWADVRLGTLEQIVLSFPSAGQGWGMFAYPRFGDVIVAGFRPGGYAVVLGYLMGNPYYERGAVQPNGTRQPPSSTAGTEVLYRPTRYLTGGELLFKSYQGAEMYMDRFANMRMIVREPRNDTEINNPNDLTIDAVMEKDKIVELWMGTVRKDDLYLMAADEQTATLKRVDNKMVSFNGTDVNVDLMHRAGLHIQIDSEGSMNTTSPKDIHRSAVGNIVEAAGLSYTIVVGDSSIIIDTDGSITATDPSGSIVKMDGAGVISILSPNGTSVAVKDDDVKVATSQASVDVAGANVVVTAQNVNINGSSIKLGQSASHPVTVSDLMATAFNALVTAFNTHTHLYSPGPGGPTPTPPPVIPAMPITPPQISSTVATAL